MWTGGGRRSRLVGSVGVRQPGIPDRQAAGHGRLGAGIAVQIKRGRGLLRYAACRASACGPSRKQRIAKLGGQGFQELGGRAFGKWQAASGYWTGLEASKQTTLFPRGMVGASEISFLGMRLLNPYF